MYAPYHTRNLVQAIIETRNYKMRLLGDQETRWTGSGEAVVILLDDFKAKEGNDNENRGNILGRLRAEAINDNGEKLCDF